MYHTIVAILLSGILSATCVAQEQATAASPKALTDAETATPSSKAIVLVIDANSQQSVAVKQVVEALEKAGIATSEAAETAPPTRSSISVTLSMRTDESSEKIRRLIEALRNAGVKQVSFTANGVQAEGREGQNSLTLHALPGYATDELHKIENAVRTAAKLCELSLVVVTKGEETVVRGDFAPTEPASDPVRIDPGLLDQELARFFGRWAYTVERPGYAPFNEFVSCVPNGNGLALYGPFEIQPADPVTKLGRFKAVNPDGTTFGVYEFSPSSWTSGTLTLKVKMSNESYPASTENADWVVSRDPANADELTSFPARGSVWDLPESAVPGRWFKVQDGKVVIAVSEDNKQAFAYCHEYPAWTAVTLNPEIGFDPQALVTTQLGIVKQGHVYHAWSRAHRAWATLTLAAGETAWPSIGAESFSVHSPTKGDYVFKDAWGKWFSAEEIKSGKVAEHLATHRPTEPIAVGFTESPGPMDQREMEKTRSAVSDSGKSPASEIKVFAVKHSEAKSTAELLEQLITTKPFRAVADERTNSVIATGTADQLLAVEALLLKLDEAPGIPNAEPTLFNRPAVGPDATTPIPQQVVQIRTEYEAANEQAHDLAESFRKTPDDAKRTELRNAVQRSFILRQSLLRAELLEMQTRLLQTQQSIDMRERIADQIVDRRIEDLLNPQLKWDGSPHFTSAESADTAVSGSSNPPAPIGLGLPEEIETGAWGEPQNGLRLAIVVKSENSLWDKAQEVQYVVENVSKAKIALRGQRNDQLATLFEVRQTSQAQVQTMPRVNSGVQETGSDVELGPGERAVIGRVWMGAVEKQTDAIPEGDPQLLIIDSNAWEFRNKIYVVRGCLQPDPDQPTVTIRSGHVAIAFHKPADTSIGSLPASSPAMPVGEDKRLDSKESLLSALQGVWDLQSHTNPGDPPDPKIKHLNVEIKGNLMTLWISTDTQRIQAWSAVLKLGEPGPPQQIDMTFDPNDGEDRMETFGLIEITDDLVRICLDHSSESQRPEVFAVGQRSEIWELRRKTGTTDPQALLLAKLQGAWDMQMQEADPNPTGGKEEAVIEGDLMTITITLDGKTVTIPVQLKLDGSPEIHEATMDGKQILLRRPEKFRPDGSPQPIDLIHFPNDKQERVVLPGIIEFREDSVRICLANSSSGERPEVFVVGKDANVWELRRPAPITELEGDWHLVSVTDTAGQSQEFSPANVSFNKDRYTFAYPYIQVDRRIQVYPDKKVIHYFSEGNDDYSESEYVLDGELLTIVDGADKKARVYHRGHVPFPKSIRKVTEEQSSRWRSGIVDIYWEHQSPTDLRQDPVGKGVVISPKGFVICQVPEEIHQGKDSKTKFMVRFDDSSFAYATIVEEADHGWFALQPTQPSNHQLPIATSPMSVGDQVHLWACDSSDPPQRVTVGLAKVILLDRQTAKADTPVCQLTRPSDFRAESCPVLSGDGELLGITMRDTGDLVLAVPVSQLKTMFPKTFGQQLNDEPQSAKELPDWLSDLQGTWTVTDSPIKVDENSSGHMKGIRIDRDQWEIVWTAKSGDADRVESLRVVRPDEKNLYAIDLVEPSTGKVVYPSLYELNQAGLTFCYGHLGTRPKEIGNVVTIKLTREQSRGAQ